VGGEGRDRTPERGGPEPPVKAKENFKTPSGCRLVVQKGERTTCTRFTMESLESREDVIL